MQVSQLFQDIQTGCLTEVNSAERMYYDSVRGLSVRQKFFVYPDDTVVALNSVDGGYSTIVLNQDDTSTFMHLYMKAAA